MVGLHNSAHSALDRDQERPVHGLAAPQVPGHCIDLRLGLPGLELLGAPAHRDVLTGLAFRSKR